MTNIPEEAKIDTINDMHMIIGNALLVIFMFFPQFSPE